MLKPKLSWVDNYIYVGDVLFGSWNLMENNDGAYFATSLGGIYFAGDFESKEEAIAQLKKWAYEFFESVIEGATDA